MSSKRERYEITQAFDQSWTFEEAIELGVIFGILQFFLAHSSGTSVVEKSEEYSLIKPPLGIFNSLQSILDKLRSLITNY